MRIAPESFSLLEPFPVDVDTNSVLKIFDEPEGSYVIEVGAHDEPVANMLADKGFKVVGIDLREYDKSLPVCNYEFLRADFCDLPIDFLKDNLGRVDSIISISAIEHFGLGTYSEGHFHLYYDLIAMRVIWYLLKEGGTAYITLPIGKQHLIVNPHWRVYDFVTLQTHIVQDFDIEIFFGVVAGRCVVQGKERHMGEIVTQDEVNSYDGDPPHISGVMKLRKKKIGRLAPGGR